MELYEQDCTAAIVQFWENFVSNMVDVMGDFSSTDEKVSAEKIATCQYCPSPPSTGRSPIIRP